MLTNKYKIARIIGVLMATMYAGIVTAIVRSYWPGLNIALVLLTFFGLWIGFYLAAFWAELYRRGELDRKFPISGRELRRRKKEFYDWLASQGRH